MPVEQARIGAELVQTIDARKLHAFLRVGRDFFLRVGRDFSTWLADRIAAYGFIEGVDFVSILDSPKSGNQTGRGGDRRSKEYHLTLDMAKELAMVERNEHGREARRYFIACERALRAAGAAPGSPPALTFDAPNRQAFGGIVKGVVRRLLEEDRKATHARLDTIERRLADLGIRLAAIDHRRAGSGAADAAAGPGEPGGGGFVSALAVVFAAGGGEGHRRSLMALTSARLRRFSEAAGFEVRRAAEDGRCLFDQRRCGSGSRRKVRI